METFFIFLKQNIFWVFSEMPYWGNSQECYIITFDAKNNKTIVTFIIKKIIIFSGDMDLLMALSIIHSAFFL